MTRLFLAAWPSESAIQHVRDVLEATADQWRGVRWIPERNWHVTLRFLDEADPGEIAAALAGYNWPSTVAEVGINLERLGTHSVVIPVSGVDGLAYAVASATDAPLDMFHGHLTVGRRIGKQTIHGPKAGSAKMAPLSFPVPSFALVASTLTAQGAMYETLTSFAIDAADGER